MTNTTFDRSRALRRNGVTLAALLLTGVAMSTLAACTREGDAKVADTELETTVGPENLAFVELDTIESGPLLSGALAAERQATVRAEIGGTVLETFVEEGERVSRGQVLARLDATNFQDAFLSARSALTTAETNASTAQRELERMQRLHEAGAIAERDLEQARNGASAAASQLADAKARFVAAEKALNDRRVRAPFSGVIAVRQVSAGDIVAPGGPMFDVIDPSSMRLEASVPATQLSALRIGAPVSFTVGGYPGREFVGRITRVSPVADPATRQVGIYVSIPNAGQTLVGGLFAEGRVATERRNALVVPAGALDITGVRPFVVRLKAGKVERVDVELGLRDDESERVEVKSGLAKGDTLLVGAARGISPGTPVKVSVPSDTPASK